MEKQPPKPMTPFDELVTPHNIYTMKLLLPYFPISMQRTFGIFIKFFEFRNTLDTFYGFTKNPPSSSSGNILSELKPFMDKKEQEMMEQMESMMDMMDMMQQMQEDPDATSPFDMMKSMMDPQQQDMFNMYSTMFDQEMSSACETADRKGESDNEK